MPILGNNDNSVQIKVETSADQSGIVETQDGLKDLGTTSEDTDKKLSTFTGNLESNLHKVAGVTAVVAGGLTLFAKSSTDYLTDLTKSSKTLALQTGMTAVESSQLVAAFGRMGIDADQAAVSFRSFSKIIADSRENVGATAQKHAELANKIQAAKIQITDLNEKIRVNGDASGELRNKVQGLTLQIDSYNSGLKDSTNSLDKLGIATVDADGKSKDFYSILLDVSDKFHDMPDGAEKTALALDLFGRSGAGMIKVLDKGSEGIKQLAADAEKLGLTLTSENIDTVDKYVKSQKDMAASTDSIRIAVGLLTAPVLTDFNTGINDLATKLVGTDGPLRDATVGILAFGGPVLGATATVIEFGANLAGVMPAIIAFVGALSAPIVMPAIAIAAAIASLVVVIAKTQETIDVIQDAGNAMENARKSGEETDASMKKLAEEGKISTDQLNTYLKNTTQTAEEAKNNLYTGFFGPMNQALDNLFVSITGRQDQFKDSGFGGFASGGFTGTGGTNEVAGLVHKGEYVFRQDQVDQSTGLPKAVPTNGGGGRPSITYHIENLNLNGADAVAEWYAQRDQDSQYEGMGMTPARGQA